LLLDGILADTNLFMLYLAPVLLSAWYGGFSAGILAFVLGGIVAVVFDGSPALSFNSFDTARSVDLLLYLAVGGLIVFLPKSRRYTPDPASTNQRQLESEVMEGKRKAEISSHLLITEQHARVDAEKASALKTQFVAMVAHELRTPLTVIKGFSTSLLADDVTWTEEDKHQFLMIMDEEADKLNELVDQLLDLSQMQSGKLRIHVQEYALPEIFSLAYTDLETLAAKHQLIMDIPQDLPMIQADPMRLAQVLLNLVGNAAKYSPQNTSITVSAKSRNDSIQVDVADQGVGIPLKERKAVFEVFQQLDDVTGSFIKGSGLGLAICKGLVEAHGGTIWINEQSTPGTVVSFTLPVLPAQP
jgi:signal transduction histidine kinase